MWKWNFKYRKQSSNKFYILQTIPGLQKPDSSGKYFQVLQSLVQRMKHMEVDKPKNLKLITATRLKIIDFIMFMAQVKVNIYH